MCCPLIEAGGQSLKISMMQMQVVHRGKCYLKRSDCHYQGDGFYKIKMRNGENRFQV